MTKRYQKCVERLLALGASLEEIENARIAFLK